MALHGNSTDAYLDWPYRLVSSIFWVPLIMIGISGNLMVILVVMTVRGMKTPTNCYLVSLAVADCLFFVSSTPVELSSIHLPEDIFVFGRVGCSILRFLPFLSMNASSLSITAFTIERYIGICHPMKARYICTVKRAQLIIVVIWTCSILYNSTWLFLTDLKPLNYTDWPNAYQCTYSLNRASYRTVFLLDLFAFYWVPLLLYLILYGSMARIVIKAGFFDLKSSKRKNNEMRIPTNHTQTRVSDDQHTVIAMKAVQLRKTSSNSNVSQLSVQKMQKMSAVSFGPLQPSHSSSPSRIGSPKRSILSGAYKRSNTNDSMATETTVTSRKYTQDNTCILDSPTNQRRARSIVKKTSVAKISGDSKAYYGESLNKSRVQVVKMLIVIVFVFALFWLPYRGLVVYNSFASSPWMEKWYIIFSKTMVMVNCAINPILYNLMSGKFRNAFVLMFRRCFGISSPRTLNRYPSETHSMAYPNSGVFYGSSDARKRSSTITPPNRHRKISEQVHKTNATANRTNRQNFQLPALHSQSEDDIHENSARQLLNEC